MRNMTVRSAPLAAAVLATLQAAALEVHAAETAPQQQLPKISVGAEDEGSGSAGTDSYGRLTADINKDIGEHSAVRVNIMGHQNDVPGRDYERFERWGVAPSVALGLGTDTTVTLSYLHQTDDNIPQYGVPFYNGRPLPGVDSGNYYGYHNVDRQEIETDSFTAIIDHRFNDSLSVRNLSRVQEVGQLSVVDATQGTWCMPNNLTPTGGACTAVTTINGNAITVVVPTGQYLPGGPRGFVRNTTNKLLYNQTDFTGLFATGAIEHTIVAGFSFSHETFELDTSSDLRNANGTNPYVAPAHLPFMDLFNINNLFDKAYYQRIRNNGWATPGEARSFIVSANYNF